jgi:histidine decarboxylase
MNQKQHINQINSCEVYPQVKGICCDDFQLPSTGLTSDQRQKALLELNQYLVKQKANFLGYQANQKMDYAEDLGQYLNFHINNIGDPFETGNFTVNVKWLERAVLDYYAQLWNAKIPHDPLDKDSYWGYVLSMGSSEGNLYGLWNARDYLAGKFLIDDQITSNSFSSKRCLTYCQASAPSENPNAYTPIVFYSQDTHYSIIKAIRVLNISTFYEIGAQFYPHENPLNPNEPWPEEVPSIQGNEGPGSVDIQALSILVEFFAQKGYPMIFCFNYGTTFKGAYDDIAAAGQALMPIFKHYGLLERTIHYDPQHPERFDTRTGFWFHVDGALGASYMPFVEMAYQQGLLPQKAPDFDFRLPFVHSLVMSGHKWVGAPWPCGIFMTKRKYQLNPPDDPEYIGSSDTTFAGSRNGFSSLILWDYLAKNSYQSQIQKAIYTEQMASYIYEQLKLLEQTLQMDLWVARTPLSLTIRFRQPNAELISKYSLSCETLFVDNEKRHYAHVFAMAHVTIEMIENLIKDLHQPNAFPQDSLVPTQVCSSSYSHHKKFIYVPHVGRGFK